MGELIADADLRTQFAKAGRERILREFSATTAAEAMEQYYYQVINQGSDA